MINEYFYEIHEVVDKNNQYFECNTVKHNSILFYVTVLEIIIENCYYFIVIVVGKTI